MGLSLAKPMIVGRNRSLVLLVAAADLDNLRAPAQTWSPVAGYSETKPVPIWLKFIPFAAVEPPEAWQEPGSNV